MKELVFIKKDDVFTNSKIIAENAKVQHHTVTKILRNYKSDFEEFGKVRFMDIISIKPEGGRPEKLYLLNEQQATLLLTYLKNTEPVREFKKNLVRQFYKMKEELKSRKEISPKYKIERQSIRDAIKNFIPESPHKQMRYVHYTNLVYKAVTGKNAKELKLERGYPTKAEPIEFLTATELELVTKLDNKVSVLIELGMNYEQIKKAIKEKFTISNMKLC